MTFQEILFVFRFKFSRENLIGSLKSNIQSWFDHLWPGRGSWHVTWLATCGQLFRRAVKTGVSTGWHPELATKSHSLPIVGIPRLTCLPSKALVRCSYLLNALANCQVPQKSQLLFRLKGLSLRQNTHPSPPLPRS